MIHGGVYPDLLDDAAWWQADDRWVYSFFALLIYVRMAADRQDGRSNRSSLPSPIVAGSGWRFPIREVAGPEPTGLPHHMAISNYGAIWVRPVST